MQASLLTFFFFCLRTFFTRAMSNGRLFPGIVRAVDGILVDRSNKTNKNAALDEIKRRTLDPTAPQVMVFPEGTCGNSNVLFRFNKGPFSLGKPVQLACFKYPYRFYNPCYNGRCVGGNELGDIILRCCCQFVNRIDVHVLPVYHPNEEEITSTPHGLLYASNMQRRMAQVGGAVGAWCRGALLRWRADLLLFWCVLLMGCCLCCLYCLLLAWGIQELNCKTSNATKKMYDEVLATFHQIERNSVSKQGDSGWTSLLRRNNKHNSGGGSPRGPTEEHPVMDSGELGGGKEECVEGDVWWPWEAYANVVEKLKEMRATKKQHPKEE